MSNHTKTTKQTAHHIASLLSPAGTVRTRNMMGGYLVYLDEVLIGQINGKHLHIKITEGGKKYAEFLETAIPHPGAKPAFRVSEDVLNNADWLVDFLVTTQTELKKGARAT
jgi:TfoX/Sxy family transcriptional regulator of competence genes